MISFSKYHGAGNDFIMIDDRRNQFDESNSSLISEMCDRHFGIGADGLMLIRNHDDHDFEMIYFNSDGNVGSMCGNGGRCIVQFAYSLGVINDEAEFLAVDGVHNAKLIEDSVVSLEMLDVHEIHNDGEGMVLDTGSPHYVREVTNLEDIDIREAGRAIRYNDTYKAEGINVNFIEYSADGLSIRTYERGVEDETLACGTGITAAALVAAKSKNMRSPIKVRALGGDLEVKFEMLDSGRFSNIWKTGPATFVFNGTYPS